VPPRACVSPSPQSFIDKDYPLYALLATPGLRDRHWLIMEAAVGAELPHGPGVTLSDMLALGLQVGVGGAGACCWYS
jgi:hypothetical protein